MIWGIQSDTAVEQETAAAFKAVEDSYTEIYSHIYITYIQRLNKFKHIEIYTKTAGRPAAGYSACILWIRVYVSNFVELFCRVC